MCWKSQPNDRTWTCLHDAFGHAAHEQSHPTTASVRRHDQLVDQVVPGVATDFFRWSAASNSSMHNEVIPPVRSLFMLFPLVANSRFKLAKEIVRFAIRLFSIANAWLVVQRIHLQFVEVGTSYLTTVCEIRVVNQRVGMLQDVQQM